MATLLPLRPNTNSTDTSASTASRSNFSSFPANTTTSKRRSGSQSTQNDSDLSARGHQHSHSSTSNHSYPTSSSQRSSDGLTLPPHHRNGSGRPNGLTNGASHTHPSTIGGGGTTTAQKPIKSQYPSTSSEKHVEYILVASFDIDRGSVMEHQYPAPVGGDEHMLAELMLPDQTHLRSQDWTIFFLHKDAGGEEEDEKRKKKGRRRRRRRHTGGQVEGDQAEGGAAEDDKESKPDGEEKADSESGSSSSSSAEEDEDEDEASSDSDNEAFDGPPLVYVLNLVNTKQDQSVKRGAVVKAMAICTRHSFLHIYKPLLLIALEQYFANPVMETLATLYDAVNSMDLSLMPRLAPYERFILQSSDAKDLFIEKFEAIIAQSMAASASNNHNAGESRDATANGLPAPSPTTHPTARARYGLPRDTHEFETLVKYANVPVPIKVPVALSPETVGDFSLIKLITMFSTPHSTSPQPFSPTHPHLTTSGALTHPIIVLLNALLTQKRIIFLGHNLPSSEVAEAVLAACALASGSMLRGFTRHAFPYTDLTKVDDLLRVPGFVAGVTNPAFALKSEWWDLLCDLSTGRMKISAKIEQAPLTEGVLYFQQPGYTPSTTHPGPGAGGGISAIAAAGASLSAGLGGNAVVTGNFSGDATGDAAFMASVLRGIEERHGENAIRSKFRRWVVKFTRLAAAFEELVYGASVLQIAPSPKPPSAPFSGAGGAESPKPESPSFRKPSAATTTTTTTAEPELPPEVTGHGYVWPTPQSKTNELAANATRIEGWRNTRSYYNYIQDLAAFYTHACPVKNIDLQHLHDKLGKLRLGHEQSANVYLAICAAVWGKEEIDQLLAVIVNAVWDVRSSTTSSSSSSSSNSNSTSHSSGGGGVGGQGQGLFYLAMGLFHPRVEVRENVADLLGRIREHEAGRHFWRGVGRFVGVGMERVLGAREARMGFGDGGEGEGVEG